MAAQSQTHSASSSDGDGGGADDELLLAALLDGMDAALCAFDADGVVTHWNREAERILGWSHEEAVGRRGLAGWAVRSADAEEVESRLLGAMHAPGRQVHEFALVTKDGGRVLVRTQSSGVTGADGRPSGVYCAFSEVHAQIDLERSIALSEALFEDASWGVVLVDADLRLAVANVHAAQTFRSSRSGMLGRPLGEFVEQGVEELEGALQHVLAEGAPPAPAEIWVTLRPGGAAGGTPADQGFPGTDAGAGPSAGQGADPAEPQEPAQRRCLRSGFLRLASPLAEEPVPLGVAWVFTDVTETKRFEQEAARLRFRDNQLHRAARAAAECEDPMEAVTVHLDFALAGFADHALLDLIAGDGGAPGASPGTPGDPHTEAPPRLVRTAATPVSAPGPVPPVEPRFASGIPVGYATGHPALQAYERCGSVRTSAGSVPAPRWAEVRKWPDGTVHGLCTVLRSRGRTLGVVTFLRGRSRSTFDRSDAAYAEDIAVRLAAAVDLSLTVTP
ncbi:PAS domain-containing protein [Streptomyces sp. ODS28]|uniref:PAS domain-containing protein n=1 Tax=Streptomyces sp. ODS28 TaxID=3136688 RepID=UPI0031E96832